MTRRICCEEGILLRVGNWRAGCRVSLLIQSLGRLRSRCSCSSSSEFGDSSSLALLMTNFGLQDSNCWSYTRGVLLRLVLLARVVAASRSFLLLHLVSLHRLSMPTCHSLKQGSGLDTSRSFISSWALLHLDHFVLGRLVLPGLLLASRVSLALLLAEVDDEIVPLGVIYW